MRSRTVLVACLVVFTTLLAKAQNPLAGLTELKADGVGTGNTAVASGTLRGSPFGNASWTYTFMGLSPATTNGQGGNCVFETGTIGITLSDGSTLSMQFGGVSCNTRAGTTSPAVNNVAYIITGGTGQFANAAGGGNVTLSAYNPNSTTTPVYIHLAGNIDLH